MKITREELVRLIAEEVIRLQAETQRNMPAADTRPAYAAAPAERTEEPKRIRKPDKSTDAKGEALEILKASTAARIGIGTR